MNELLIPFNFGQNNKLPAITSKEFFATKLENYSVEDGYIKMPTPYIVQYSPTSVIVNFGYTFEPTSKLSDIYAFSQSVVYRLRGGSTLATVESFTVTADTAPKWAVVPWKEKLYYTRPDVPIRRLQGNTAIPIVANTQNDKLAARYAVAAHDHLWLGNVSINGTVNSTTVMWSDLYNPENFNVSELTEADSFRLSVDDLEITGLATHRNQVLIFTANSVWTANYVGLPDVYAFQPLFGVGASYHDSVIRVQDKVYFISTTGIYKVDSFQLVEIGQDVWPVIRDLFVGLDSIPAAVDEKRKLIYWTVGSATYMYNYEDNRWATYSFVYARAILTFPKNVKTTATIDEVTVAYTALTGVTFDQGYNTVTVVTGQLFANSIIGIGKPDVTGTVYGLATTIDLVPFFENSLFLEKEISEVKLLADMFGVIAPVLTVYTKDAQTGTELANAFTMVTDTGYLDEMVFKTRNISCGKVLRMSLTFTNSTANYLRSITGLSVRMRDDGTAEQ